MNGDREGFEEDVKMEKLVFMWGYLPGALPQRLPLLSPLVVRLPPSSSVGTSWKDVCGGGCGFAMAISDSGKLITWGSTDDLGQSFVTSGKHGEKPEPFPLPTETPIVKAAACWAHCVAITGIADLIFTVSIKIKSTPLPLILLRKDDCFTASSCAYVSGILELNQVQLSNAESGEVYTWGWKECVPSGKVFGSPSIGLSIEKDVFEKQSLLTEQGICCLAYV
ncbi:Hypothetical predicted protein [Olea europaea subsp. europaea]|uniref:Uncharacterized protein n=1 Tax=Olea europaea subsp. europaea TaxID=158383 RepID=A0A8S0RB48_OLEEU|nr:Hypothetical predicted protein [Olea europaea subsp. europaea]